MSIRFAGIGVDTTGSTPLPLDESGRPLAFNKKFAKNPAAMAWLWKDHTGVAEAGEITELAKKIRPQFLAKCGGVYSSEWFWSKILKCLRVAPEVFNAAHSWVELADYVPAELTGTLAPEKLTVGICAAGHKAMFNDTWGGYPDVEFLSRLDPKLGELRGRLCTLATQSIGTATTAIDDLSLDIVLVFTSATAAYWSIYAQHSAATATGFGVATGSASFSGTLSALTTTTGSLIFGIGYSNTTGTAVITLPFCTAEAYGVN